MIDREIDEYEMEERKRREDMIAQYAAEIAVRRVFSTLGIDVDKPESVAQFQEDLRFGRSLRKAAGHSVFVFITVVTTAIAAATWFGIASKFRGDE